MSEPIFTEPDPEFDAWRDSLPDKHWAKYDLSACRLGWDAAKARAESALRQANARIAEMEGALRSVEDHLAATTDLGWHQNEAVKVVRAALRSQSEETR